MRTTHSTSNRRRSLSTIVLSWLLLLQLLLPCCRAASVATPASNDNHHRPGSSLRARATRRTAESVICKVLLEEILSNSGEAQPHNEEFFCQPIVNDKIMDVSTSIRDCMSRDMILTYHDEILAGQLIVSLSPATVSEEGHVTIGDDDATLTVLDNVHLDRHRHLNQYALDSGPKTLAVVRLSTASTQQEDSVGTIQSTIFDGGATSLVTQIAACSHQQLTFAKAPTNGIVSLQLPGTNADYDHNPTTLVEAAQLLLQTEGYGPGSALADRTIFCLPDGFGADWAARAAMNHWRITMNHGWCLSLSAAMHELGHTMGLGHADEMGGYMGASYRNAEWPQKCYNGYQHHQLEWFSDQEVQWNANLGTVKLASFVDAENANHDEAVLVNIANQYFVQYNVRKSFNAGTDAGLLPALGDGRVTVHEKLPGNAHDTELVANLAVGETVHVSGPGVYVKVCESHQRGAVDVAHVSFATSASSLCQEVRAVGSDEEDNLPVGGGGGGGTGLYANYDLFMEIIAKILVMVFGGKAKGP